MNTGGALDWMNAMAANAKTFKNEVLVSSPLKMATYNTGPATNKSLGIARRSLISPWSTLKNIFPMEARRQEALRLDPTSRLRGTLCSVATVRQRMEALQRRRAQRNTRRGSRI